MGLAERRRIAAIKDKYSTATKQLQDAIGFELPLSFDADTLPEDVAVLDSFDYYESYAIPMVINIFKDICRDDLGVEAVKAHIQSIHLVNTSQHGEDPGEKSLSLQDGKLLIKYGFYQYSDSLWGEDLLKKEIEALL